MSWTAWLAAVGLAIPLYAYLLYPALLFALASSVQMARDLRYLLSRNDRRRRSGRMPAVSLLLAAHNEEAVIARTLESLLALDYPKESLEILVGSDASDDRTVALARAFEERGVRVAAFAERRGKLSVLNDLAACATGEVLAFCDANTLLRPDALRHLVRHFDDPHVGAVCGELRLQAADGGLADEGAYWRYEATLKLLESRMDSALGANGAIYAVRRELFPILPAHLITEDFIIPMKIRARGHRVMYDPEAVAVEEAPTAPTQEFRRRMRIGAGNWQALWHCRELLLPWKGFVSFAFWSHKVCRWIAPFGMAAAFLASLALGRNPVWQCLLAAQIAFYLAALLGWVLTRLRLPAGPLRPAYYFLLINLALAAGFWRGALGRQRPAWQRTERAPARSEP